MLIPISIIILGLAANAVAHFKLLYPAARSTSEVNQNQFPCGGNPISIDRTVVNLAGFPVALDMGHDRSAFQVLLALGNSPGDNFNIVLKPTFQQIGLGSFCMTSVSIPSSANVQDRQNATLQVITNAEGGGGLYMCADITFAQITTLIFPAACKNGTGAAYLPINTNINANQSTPDGRPQSGVSISTTASVTGSTSSSTTGSATGATTVTSTSASTNVSNGATTTRTTTGSLTSSVILASQTGQAMAMAAGWSMLGVAAMGVLAGL